MKPSRADRDDAIRAYAAMRSSCSGMPEGAPNATFKDVLLNDLSALSTVVVAYTYEERISRSDYGEYLRVLTRWLGSAEAMVEV
jgi:hypothetical protein